MSARPQTTEDKVDAISEIITTVNSTPLKVLGVTSVSNQALVTVNTPSPQGFTSGDVEQSGDDTVDIDASDFTTGLKGQLTTDGTLPTGYATSTDYFVIKDDDGFMRLSSSLANALAGTAVTITGAGSGNHTFTPTALADASIKWQRTNGTDEEVDAGSATWNDIADSTSNIAVTGAIWYTEALPLYRYLRAQLTLTAGRMSVSIRQLVVEP